MKILVSWLRDYVDVPGTPEEIARTMSLRGFAVEGIEEAPPGALRPGAPAAGADAVLDFEVTANRPDAMSVLGIAREVATAYELPLRVPGAGGDAFLRTAALASSERAGIDVVIEDPDLCPRYAGAVADVTVGESPGWMQARLQAAGVRPISNIVDVTNYVLLELGQPMHAFDLARLAEAQIRVRAARGGERLRTLDGQTRELAPGMLVIADAERAAAVAGVMGGADSEVASQTTAIVFESAYFNPLSVRRTSKRLGLKTEASMRFERGADVNIPGVAMARACALLEIIGAGTPRGTIVDRYPAPRAASVLRLRRKNIPGLLGQSMPDTEVETILGRLGFELRAAADGWDVTVPTRRVDVAREVDLIEEVARHYGFDRLPTTFPELTRAAAPIDPRIRRARLLRSVLTAAGFSEAVTFGFVAEPAAVPFSADGDLVPIANPLSENFAVLRPSVLPGLIDAVAHNRRREQRDVRLFEVGNRFSRESGERAAVACAWSGAAVVEHWGGGGREVDFFDMKGVAERICAALRVEVRTEPHAEPWLVPGRSAVLVHDGTRIAILGQVARPVAEAHGLPPGDAVYVAEVDLDAADRVAAKAPVRVESLPRYPSVTRDISVLIDETLAAETVRGTMRAAAPATLVRVREFDRYQGKGIPEGKVSLSLRLTFRSPERTLTDSEVQAAMDAVLGALKSEHGAAQR